MKLPKIRRTAGRKVARREKQGVKGEEWDGMS
jgi:hypothetical protein